MTYFLVPNMVPIFLQKLKLHITHQSTARSYTQFINTIKVPILLYLARKECSWDSKNKGCGIKQAKYGSSNHYQDVEVMRSRVVGSGEGNWLELSSHLSGTRNRDRIRVQWTILVWLVAICNTTGITTCTEGHTVGLYHIWCCLYAQLDCWLLSEHILGLARLLDMLNWIGTLLDLVSTQLDWIGTLLGQVLNWLLWLIFGDFTICWWSRYSQCWPWRGICS